MSLGTNNYIVKIRVERNFGLRDQYYGSGTYEVDVPYLIPIKNDQSYFSIKEELLKGEVFWKPVEHFLKIFENDKFIHISDIEKFLDKYPHSVSKISNTKINYTLDDYYNDIDLAHISYDDNRLSFYFDSSPICNIDIFIRGNVIEVIVEPKSGSCIYGISEYDWEEFVKYIVGGTDIKERRNNIIDDILKHGVIDSNIDETLIRRLKYKSLIEGNISFLKSVYSYYLKYGKLSNLQIKKSLEIIRK